MSGPKDKKANQEAPKPENAPPKEDMILDDLENEPGKQNAEEPAPVDDVQAAEELAPVDDVQAAEEHGNDPPVPEAKEEVQFVHPMDEAEPVRIARRATDVRHNAPAI